MKVRGAVLRSMGLPKPYVDSRPLEIVELELAPPGPGELLIRVGAAGLCHSDLSVIDGSRPRVMPMVLGHEAAGEVVESGGDAGVRARRPRRALVRADLRGLRAVPRPAARALRAGRGGQRRRHAAQRRAALGGGGR